MDFFYIIKSIYLYWVYLSILIYLLHILFGIFHLFWQKSRNMKKVWLHYDLILSIYTEKLDIGQKVLFYWLNFLSILWSWVFVIIYVKNIFIHLFWFKPEKIKEMEYKISNFDLSKSTLEKIAKETNDLMVK